MERNKTNDDAGSPQSEADIVESGGETTAAATGSAEIEAATGAHSGESAGNARPVGADTRVKVAGEPDSTES
jgi:hypothetical protein